MLTDEIPNDNFAMKDLIDDNKRFIKNMKHAIENTCNLQKTIKQNEKYKTFYKTNGYKLMSRNDIYESVVQLLK
jgi:5-bromo-4-chloroindolyl phosphate hydrolysis protein